MSTPLSRARIAIGSYPYYRYSIDYFLDTAVRLGFVKVELWAAAPQVDLEALTPHAAGELAAKLRSRGLEVITLTPEQCNYPYNLAAAEPGLRERSIRYFCRGADLAAELGCKQMLVSAGCGCYDRPRSEALNRSRDSIAQVADYAAARGVELLFETLTPASSNLVNTPEQVAQMLRELPAGRVHGMLDIGQMTVMNQTVARYGAALGSELRHVHLHDTGAACHMALGDGALDLPAIVEEILELGYTGDFALECNDARYRADPRAADEQNCRWLRARGWF